MIGHLFIPSSLGIELYYKVYNSAEREYGRVGLDEQRGLQSGWVGLSILIKISTVALTEINTLISFKNWEIKIYVEEPQDYSLALRVRGL
jgi:hypothetical protein